MYSNSLDELESEPGEQETNERDEAADVGDGRQGERVARRNLNENEK